MRFRLPKPLHGWREFIGEVGIIVLGVMIALAAGQVVEAWQWRQRVKQADQGFRDELETAIQNAYVRLAIEGCLTPRLTEIEAKLNAPGENWRGMSEQGKSPPSPQGRRPIPVYNPYVPAPPIVTEAWSNALANGTVNHLPYQEASYLSDAYEAARRLKDDMRQEQLAVASLAPLETDRKLTSDNRIPMLQSVRHLYTLDGIVEDDSLALLFSVQEVGPYYTIDAMRSYSAGLVAIARKDRGQCVTEPKIPPAPT